MKRYGIAIAAALALGGCSFGKDLGPANAAVSRFHQMLNRGEFPQIYDASAADMKQSGSRDDFVKFLSAVHTNMGAFRQGQTIGWHENFNSMGTFVTLNYSAKYDRGTAQETFTFKVEDSGPVLNGYDINSPALIVN